MPGPGLGLFIIPYPYIRSCSPRPEDDRFRSAFTLHRQPSTPCAGGHLWTCSDIERRFLQVCMYVVRSRPQRCQDMSPLFSSDFTPCDPAPCRRLCILESLPNLSHTIRHTRRCFLIFDPLILQARTHADSPSFKSLPVPVSSLPTSAQVFRNDPSPSPPSPRHASCNLERNPKRICLASNPLPLPMISSSCAQPSTPTHRKLNQHYSRSRIRSSPLHCTSASTTPHSSSSSTILVSRTSPSSSSATARLAVELIHFLHYTVHRTAPIHLVSGKHLKAVIRSPRPI
ncbi:hypothetical protein R3P38DRAFT_1328175 [Favolaschia claudopus]|uniref:Uncharacterized protein n=1 Tax=Favolaschia claudopus TaxID=2862362 RepID=A0AAW0ATC2_9AGAR